MTSAFRAPGAGTAVCKWQYEYEGHLEKRGRTAGGWCIFSFFGSGQLFDVFQDIFGGKFACVCVSRREEEIGDKYVLGFRSVMTTPHRSRTALSLFRSKSRSVVPDAVPVGMIASLAES